MLLRQRQVAGIRKINYYKSVKNLKTISARCNTCKKISNTGTIFYLREGTTIIAAVVAVVFLLIVVLIVICCVIRRGRPKPHKGKPLLLFVANPPFFLKNFSLPASLHCKLSLFWYRDNSILYLVRPCLPEGVRFSRTFLAGNLAEIASLHRLEPGSAYVAWLSGKT